MPRALPQEYFHRPPFRATGPLTLGQHTCTACGARAHTWEGFRAHRAVCRLREDVALLARLRAALEDLGWVDDLLVEGQGEAVA